ncbi:hypothetical protein [Streptomyces tsukubensis]|uniref:hypothetical protein n=1 Tax=Streptomyces tsukubensis TaxID=83656 RepID=UPI00344E84F8
MNRTTSTAAAAAVLLAVVTGCSSDGGDGGKGPDRSTEKTAENPVEDILAAARSYQEAANARDWRAVCELRTERFRDGTVQQCAARNTPPAKPATPSPEASSPSFEPPRYADGSTPEPRAKPSTGGPEYAETGPVTAAAPDVVQVPAAEDHPAGWGALVSYTVTWPGKPSTTSLRALRLVDEGGWKVDQQEDVQDGDMGRGSPVLAALTGG